MRTHKLLDVLFLQETHINTNTEETHDQYHFFFSTCVTDKQREEANKTREMLKAGKGRGKNTGKNQLQLIMQPRRSKTWHRSCIF